MIRLQRGIGCLQIIPSFPCFEGKRRHAVWWRLYFPAGDLIYCCTPARVKGCSGPTVILGVDLGEGPGIHTGFDFKKKKEDQDTGVESALSSFAPQAEASEVTVHNHV